MVSSDDWIGERILQKKKYLEQCSINYFVLSCLLQCRVMNSREMCRTGKSWKYYQGCEICKIMVSHGLDFKKRPQEVLVCLLRLFAVALMSHIQVCGIDVTHSSLWCWCHTFKFVVLMSHIQVCGVDVTHSSLWCWCHIFKFVLWRRTYRCSKILSSSIFNIVSNIKRAV